MFFKKLKEKFKKKKNIKNNKEEEKKEQNHDSLTTPEKQNSLKFKTANLSNLHLVVDDAKSNRFILVKFLERLNIKCDEAENGELAIEKIKSKNKYDKYDILWVDLKMPIMDGIEMVRILRQDLKYKGYIVGVTGNIEKETVQKCLFVGFDKVMSKPILMGDFYALNCLQPYQTKK